MKLFLLAACVALAAAWTPGPRDVCNPTDVRGGTLLLAHERYCQLFYSCDLDGNQFVTRCPVPSLFAYGVGTATCTIFGTSDYLCPKWSCGPTDIGRRYPDVCCDRYFECTATGKFEERSCQVGTSYDTTNEVCSVNNVCNDDAFCWEKNVATGINICVNSPSSNGDPCKYRTEGWQEDRLCPVGTSYDQTTCSCSTFNEGCSSSGLTQAQYRTNKEPDSQCRASGRMDFASNNLRVVSDKLGRDIDHYFFRTGGFTVNGFEAVFDTTLNNIPYIYDYYYNDNTLYAPLAITMSVRFDLPNAVNVGTSYNLLENRWTTDNANSHCSPVTLRFTATYNGLQNGQRQWGFSVTARGSATGINIESTASGSILGTSSDYFRLVFIFNGQISGTVTNRGQSGSINGQSVTLGTDNRNIGTALLPNKCGFAIGRGLSGRIREFNVYEGCLNTNTLG